MKNKEIVTDESKKIEKLIPELKQAGLFEHFNIDFVYQDEKFTPELVDEFAKDKKINKNRVFIGSINHKCPFDYEDFGGVRIVF